jgi:3-dehydro-L-gulonate 2-dehydrogenase
MLSFGNATWRLTLNPLREAGLSQVFVAIHATALGDGAGDRIADEVVESLHRCTPAEDGKPVRYPGEQTLRTREENRRLGLPVEPAVWEEILAMAKS